MDSYYLIHEAHRLGAAFKGNCNDLRNTKALVLKRLLESYGFSMEVVDPWVDPEQMRGEFGQYPIPLERVREEDCLIFASDHREIEAQGCRYWNL